MADQAIIVEWLIASVAVPIAIGVGSAVATHSLAVRKARLDLRLVDRRKSYNERLPALAEVVAYDRRQLRSIYHEYSSQESEDLARAQDDERAARHSAAMSVISDVVAKRELAASTNVLKALDELMAEYSHVDPQTHSWGEACEAFAAASVSALDAVRKEIAREA